MSKTSAFPAKLACFAAIQGFVSVAAGAFGAHALTKMVSERALSWWHTGSQYLMYHALASLIVAALFSYIPAVRKIIVCFLVGNVFFAGSLYVMTFTGVLWLGAITPIGGVLYLLAWFLLAKNLWQGQFKVN
ncbi:hypothetical protein MSP8887_04360 [Marinomonas spartinae]|uniref:DUF423 domain-containing protein n=1 Tax=Marinomonas spartinae TaxID=1792290 RepID=UPI000808F828|nr:DUF423 domain-containing protein [Marinomonas spartinae]SBS40404.1 hypothetical protein MSP8887_04360 [Marinomonas spartinae]